MRALHHILAGFCLLACYVFAFPPDMTSTHLLSHEGEIISSTLQPAYAQRGRIVFVGQITLTGVLERSDNYDMGEYSDSLRFYPDSNLSLPFMYNSFPPLDDSYNKQIWQQSIKDYKTKDITFETKLPITDPKLFSTLFKRLKFGVLLTNRDILLPKLPKDMQERIYGTSALRVRITLTDYRLYGEGDAGGEAEAKAIDILPLGNVEQTYEKLSYHNGKMIADYRLPLALNTKDSYVNLRKSPNGQIITAITKGAMAQGAMIVSANDEDITCEELEKCLSQAQSKWIEVYYIPPNATSGRDVRFGYIHISQIKPMIANTQSPLP